MIKETVTMSHKELDRLHIIQESLNRHITQEQAAARIGISIRQVKRLVQRYRNEGPSGLVSRRRGKRPNNSFSTEFRATVISLLKAATLILDLRLRAKNCARYTACLYPLKLSESGW
jgi:transposase